MRCKTHLNNSAKQEGANKKGDWRIYIADALAVFKPPEKLTVSEWSDKYRILSEKTRLSLDHGVQNEHHTSKGWCTCKANVEQVEISIQDLV